MQKHIPLGLVLLLSAFLRFYALDASSLWSDEGNSWALMGRSFSQIAADAAADIHPPGYYWLLKIWTQIFSSSAMGMRSFSAVAGCILVWVIYQIGLRLPSLGPKRDSRRWALLAALFAALHPLQIYYSQEARMYMLLALEGALLFWSVMALLDQKQFSHSMWANRSWLSAGVGFVLAGSVGLWTHYSFPMLLAVAGATYLLHWFRCSRSPRPFWLVGRFLMLNGVILFSYLPWLNTAVDRILNWPQGGESTPPVMALWFTLRTMTVGPLRNVSESTWLLAMGLLPLLGVYALWRIAKDREPRYNTFLGRYSDENKVFAAALPGKEKPCFRAELSLVGLLFWLCGPILVMFGLGLFSEAFLKFLLTASPAWCLLCAAAAGVLQIRRPHWLTAFLLPTGLAAMAIALGLYALPGYYADPMARDNYAGVARYVQAVGDLQTDLVVLDAPGQQEVWRYYNVAMPTLALPQQRPADPARTIDILAAATAERHAIFALFWATDEADPERIVESWLDQNAFKGVSSWQGNLRFVNYTMGGLLFCQPFDSVPVWENQIRLTEWCRAADSRPVAAGEVALVRLLWQSPVSQVQSYKVSLQLLNANNQIVAQRDGEPAGSLRPTTSWVPAEVVVDNHGLAIPPGTPPGSYRLIVVLYSGQSGVRVRMGDSDHFVLGEITVSRAPNKVPLEVIPIQHRYQTRLGPVQFVGYDLYKQGFAHAPTQPLEPGDDVHVTLYWQAPAPLPSDWPAALEFVLQLGDQEVRAALAGADYPTAQWQSGEFARGEFDLLFDGVSHRPTISVDNSKLRLAPVP